MKERNVDIIEDKNGRKIVVIQHIRFKGKRNINWKEVEEYLKEYVGQVYKIEDENELIYIGKELPDEYSGSKDTARLKGAAARAKANAAQGIPELLKISKDRRYKENLAAKHQADAKFGWYRYDSRFAIPVLSNEGEVAGYSIYKAEMLIRHAADTKMYLYDIVNIKKETSTPLEQ